MRPLALSWLWRDIAAFVEESKAGLVQDGLLIGGQPPTRLDRHEALFFQVGLGFVHASKALDGSSWNSLSVLEHLVSSEENPKFLALGNGKAFAFLRRERRRRLVERFLGKIMAHGDGSGSNGRGLDSSFGAVHCLINENDELRVISMLLRNEFAQS